MRAVPRSIARVLDAALAADPDREALVTRSRRRSYGELDGLADRAAHALADLGERLGERVAAVVEPAPGVPFDEGAVRAHCLAHLARYKVPERFVVGDVLPRNAMGKIVRAALHDALLGAP